MIWSGTLAVAVDEQGNTLTSPDGISWTRRDSGGPPWNSIIITGSGHYLANSSLGPQSLSKDGLQWTRSWQNASIKSAAALGTKTLGTDGGMDSGYLYMSVNDTDWKRVGADSQGVSPIRNRISGVASNGRIVVAVGSHAVEGVVGSGTGLSAVSYDGETWGFSKTQSFKDAYRIRWVKDRFFALNLNVLASSFDGLNWSPASFLPQAAFPLDVVWSGSQFIAVGSNGLILASNDGTIWQPASSPFGIKDVFSCVIWTGSRLILGGSSEGYQYIVTTDRNALTNLLGDNPKRQVFHRNLDVRWLQGQRPMSFKSLSYVLFNPC